MMRSLFSSIAGLRNHQTMMDVIGNNIANVNTVGFKKSTVTFSTMLSQTLQGASSPTNTLGGTNAKQVGLGSTIAGITQVMNTSSTQTTGIKTNMAETGAGFFILSNGNQTLYTRDGSFIQDADGNLVSLSGAKVMGFMWGMDDQIPADFSSLAPITFPEGSTLPLADVVTIPERPATYPGNGWLSETVYANDNLIGRGIDPAELDLDVMTFNSGTGVITFKTVTDAIDAKDLDIHPLTELDVTLPSPTGPFPTADGWANETTYTNAGWIGASFDELPEGAVWNPSTGTLTFNTTTAALAAAGTYDLRWTQPTLASFSVDQSGVITGVYSNGISSIIHKIGQVAIASFNNPAGLEAVGGNNYIVSNNSGIAHIGAAGTDGRGTIIGSAVEMSNVELAEEMTSMIISQRGFQANARTITVSDSLLEELINLKR
ncbi:MAG: flagellar hook-basal body complex protein [Peptococcaceae bacterium]|jgi:flagellar hook protein FlgE|nr:flagellar hook-basal body complex protein [Peptococcaceae bacterium]